MPGRPNGSPSSRFAAQPEVAVGEREHRLGLREPIEVERGLAHRPRLDRERGMLDHGRVQQLGEVLDDDVGAVLAQRVGLADAVDADDEAEASRRGPASTPASASSNTAAARGSTPSARAPARYVSGAGLPCRCSRSATTPSMTASNRSVDPGRAQHVAAFVLEETTARRSPALDHARARSAPSPRTARRRARGSASARSRSCGCRGRRSSRRSGGSLGRPLRQLDPARREERAARRRSAACRRRTRRSPRRRRTARTARRAASAQLAQELVEHLLPRRGVHLRGLRQHAVEVEQARGRRRRVAPASAHRIRSPITQTPFAITRSEHMATDKPMQLGMVGLGRMGAGIVRRLMADGHRCVGYDVSADAVDGARGRGDDRGAVARGVRRQAREAARRLGDGAGRRDHRTDDPARSPTVFEAGDVDHRRRQHPLPRRHPPRAPSCASAASTTSTAAPAAACGGLSAASA